MTARRREIDSILKELGYRVEVEKDIVGDELGRISLKGEKDGLLVTITSTNIGGNVSNDVNFVALENSELNYLVSRFANYYYSEKESGDLVADVENLLGKVEEVANSMKF